MSPELKAFRYYRKNIDTYLEKMEHFWGDDRELMKMYDEIAAKFGARGVQLLEINQISYNRSVGRSFRHDMGNRPKI